jgi:hypothetical protein
MNKTLAEAGVFADAITAAERPDAELFVIPPHTAIFTVAQRLQGTGVRVGAQDGLLGRCRRVHRSRFGSAGEGRRRGDAGDRPQ